MDIRRALEDMTDPKNADFLSRLIPDKPRERILGIKSPEIKRFARELSGSRDAKAFMNDLPHFYLEEDLLHAALICLENRSRTSVTTPLASAVTTQVRLKTELSSFLFPSPI